jgi:hypothetical protein
LASGTCSGTGGVSHRRAPLSRGPTSRVMSRR